jgi:hypothetical protein
MTVVAFVTDALAIRRILDHLGLSTREAEKPPPAPREVLRVAEHGGGADERAAHSRVDAAGLTAFSRESPETSPWPTRRFPREQGESLSPGWEEHPCHAQKYHLATSPAAPRVDRLGSLSTWSATNSSNRKRLFTVTSDPAW